MFQKQENLLKNAKVAVIGDFMLDEFVFGRVDRISPEAPVPVVHVTDRQQSLGGAGNVLLNLQSLGAEVMATGLIGHDAAGETVKLFCKDHSISCEFLVMSDTRPTTFKTRVVASGQHVVRVDDEYAGYLTPAERVDLVEKLKEMRKKADVLIVSDYAKGVIDQGMMDVIREMWHGAFIAVDPKPRKEMHYAGASLITPNLREATLLSHEAEPTTDEEAEQMVKALQKALKIDHVLLTRASAGMTLLDGQLMKHFKSHVREVRDVSGAGDTVISVMAAAVANGLSLPHAAELANAAGGVVVSKVGTALCTWEEIVDELAHH